MQKRIVTCPKCKTQVAVENKSREAFVDISCPNCNARMRVAFDMAETVLPQEVMEDRTIPGSLRLNGKDYPLQVGKQTVGRLSSSGKTDLGLISSDRSMSRIHCLIEVVRMKNGRYKSILQDARGEEKTQAKPLCLSGERLLPGERIVMHDGDSIQMGDSLVEFVQRKYK